MAEVERVEMEDELEARMVLADEDEVVETKSELEADETDDKEREGWEDVVEPSEVEPCGT